MKRFQQGFLRILCLLLALTVMVPAASAVNPETQVFVQGVHIDADPGAVLSDSVTYVPLRAFMDSLGISYTIEWNEKKRRAYVYAPGLYLTVKEGAKYLTANDRCLYFYGESFLLNDRLMVPVRALAKACGMEVIWDEETRDVRVEGKYTPILCGDYFYDETELYWLSRIIYSEAGIEELDGQIAVGNVVLNRVARKSWPNSIYGVVFDERFGVVQFTPVANGTIYQEPGALSVVAAKIALEGTSVVGDSLYFVNESIADGSWFQESCTYVTTVGRHSFYTSDVK